jgi:PAS domain S-box-containing protein
MKNSISNKTTHTGPAGNCISDAQTLLSIMESDEKYRVMTELSNDGIVVVQKGIIRESNYCLAKMCGYGLEEVVDKCFANFFRSEDIGPVGSLCRDALKTENTAASLEATLVCKNGHRLMVEITAARCTFQQNPAVFLIIRDVSQRRDAKTDQKNIRTLDSIAALSGGIAHDYNNLLTAIIGNITLAQTFLDNKDKPFKLLDHALAASRTAKNLTQKLITFSKGGAPNKETTALDRLAKSATEFTLSGSNIKCSYSFAPDLWLVDVDPSQIGQAIHNVVMNAREAMPDGGTIQVTAANVSLIDDIPTPREGNYVRISITDQGNGIPEVDFDKIFDPYYSTKRRGSRKGTGLGLSICHSILTQHGGEVSVTSQIGSGTTLHLYLPAAQGDSPATRSPRISDQNQPIFGQGKILVMDDEKMIRELAGEILEYLGYTVEFAGDGVEAVAVYREALDSQEPFDAVILDLTVRGGMGGKETIRKLMEIDPDVKGLVSSGYSDDPGLTDFKQHGFSGAVAKPYSLQELGGKLSQVLYTASK